MKISVILAAYNSVKSIGAAIESVLNQSCQADEIIVVDDGSVDATSEVAKMYPDVLLLRQSHMGYSAALNNGIMMAESAWIAFLDPKDRWHHNMLAFCQEFSRNHAEHNALYADERCPDNFMAFTSGCDRTDIELSGLLCKKSLLEQVGGFDETMTSMQSYDLWLRLLDSGSVGCLDNVTDFSAVEDEDAIATAEGVVKALEKHLDGAHDALVRDELIRRYKAIQKLYLHRNDQMQVETCRLRIEQLEAGY